MNKLVLSNFNNIENRQEKSLADLLPDFLNDQDVSSSSKETYCTALNSLFQFLERSSITYPNRADLIKYKEELSKTHSAKTVNLRLSVIRNFFSWTQFYGLYPNIAFNIKSLRSNKNPKRQALTSFQVNKILKSIDTSTLCGRQKYAIVLLCSTNGLRISEVSSLNTSDLITVQNHPVLLIQGKGYSDKSQMVLVGEATALALRSALSMRHNLKPEDPMFISTSNRDFGNRITSKGIGQLLKNILIANHFTGSFYTAHSFRHTACCLALEATESDLVSVKKYMRHENIETTMIYANHDQIFQNDIVSEIENLILN